LPKDSTQKGTEFEAQVAALYRSAGYDITQNYSISGTDFDLLCKKEVSPQIAVSIVVECKFKSGREKVGPLDVEKFSNKFRFAKDFGITHGVMICSNGFTPTAHVAAGRSNITLRSLTELEDDLLGFAAKFVLSRRKYQASDIFQEYFGLEGRNQDELGVPDIEHFISAALDAADASPKRFFLLGDFGAGKTTLVDRINYRLQDQYLKDRRSKIPVVFRLNRLLVENDLRRFVENQLKSELGLDLNAEAFFGLLANGRIVVCLDGLDEIESHSDEQAKIHNIARISPFFNSKSDLIITSRPTMFKSKAQMLGFFSYIEQHESVISVFDNPNLARVSIQVVMEKLRVVVGKYAGQTLESHKLAASELIAIRPLSTDAVVSVLNSKRAVLEASQSIPIEEIVRELFNIYDLSDLMSRPFLLFMVIDVLKIHKIKEMIDQKTISSAVLYNIYIESYLKRDWDKGTGRQFLSPLERRTFSQCMALSMLYKAGRLSVTLSEIFPVLRRVMNEKMSADRRSEIESNIQNVVSDVLLCAFLRMSGDEMFEFVHKSFMEYFSAEFIAAALVEGAPNQLINELGYELNQEILQFVGGLSAGFHQLGSRLVAQLSFTLASGANIYRRNLAAALVYSNRDRDIELVNVTIADCNFRRKTIKRSLFSGAKFSNCTFLEANISASRAVDLEFKECKFVEGQIAQMEGEIRFCDVSCDGLALSQLQANWSKTSLLDGRIDRCKIGFEAGVRVRRSAIEGGSIELVNRSSLHNAFESVSLSNSAINQVGETVSLGGEINLLKNPQLDFANCHLSGVVFSFPVLRFDFGSLDNLQGCSGVFFASLLDLSKDAGCAALIKPTEAIHRTLSPFFRLCLEKENRVLIVDVDSDEGAQTLRRLIDYAGTVDAGLLVRVLMGNKDWLIAKPGGGGVRGKAG